MNWKLVTTLFLILAMMPVVFAQAEETPDRTQAAEWVRNQIRSYSDGVELTFDTGIQGVGDMIRTQEQIRAQDMNQFSEEIRVRAGVVEFDGGTETASGKTITVTVNDKEINIEPGVNTVVIRDGDVIVNTTELQFRNGKMYKGNTEIDVTPQQIRERIQNAEINRFELREQNGIAFYACEAEQNRKLLGLFPVRAQISAEYNAQTGETIKEVRPWWYALSTLAE